MEGSVSETGECANTLLCARFAVRFIQFDGVAKLRWYRIASGSVDVGSQSCRAQNFTAAPACAYPRLMDVAAARPHPWEAERAQVPSEAAYAAERPRGVAGVT